MTSWQQGYMLDAVEKWAFPDYWLIRETTASVDGRLDGLLVPCSFTASVLRRRPGYWTDKLAVVGIEVKTSREDFLKGMREKQFERYANTSSGLFVVTSREVKTKEVPIECGHLLCFDDQKRKGLGFSIVCRRMPKWKEIPLDQDTAWRIVMTAGEQLRKQRNDMRREYDSKLDRMGKKFARSLKQLEE